MAEITAETTYAAIDLGSNSFHMVVASVTGEHVKMIDRLRRPVRLGAGLDKNGSLKEQTMQKALAALAEFQQRLRGVPADHIRAVGTNTLRRASNAREFGLEAERVLGAPIEIIAGREEARLIYKGVTYGVRDQRTRLVVDIGGGSTELISGRGVEPQIMESINAGCVSSHQRWFATDENKFARKWQRAVQAAETELETVAPQYRGIVWERCVGSSGTIKAAERTLVELGYADHGIHREHLEDLTERLVASDGSLLSELKQISADRRVVLAGGLAVLVAILRTFDIDIMLASHSALREGVIVDLLADRRSQDQAAHNSGRAVRANAIADLQRRFQIDQEQVERVTVTARRLFEAVWDSWQMSEPRDLEALIWACGVHEIGLSVSHVQYHKHGDYLLRHADMLGFSRNDQALLASLVRNHRRKIAKSVSEGLAFYDQRRYPRLLCLLRLAVLAHRGRNASTEFPVRVKAGRDSLQLRLPTGWLEANPLTRAALENEVAMFARIDIELTIETD